MDEWRARARLGGTRLFGKQHGDLQRSDLGGPVVTLDVFRDVVTTAVRRRGRRGFGDGKFGGCALGKRGDRDGRGAGNGGPQYEAPAGGLGLAFGHGISCSSYEVAFIL